MKKFLVCILAMLLIFTLAVPVFAEETTESDPIESDTEPVVGTEIHPPEKGADDTEEDLSELWSKKFEEWIVPHLEEISVIITLIGTLFYQIRKNKSLGKTIGTMNNNTITIAEQSTSIMNQALTGMENVSAIVTAYDARIAALLTAHDETAKDKERLEKELTEIRTYLKTSAESNIEFANELAELLGLANIPNYKKEEIGARHLAAVKAIKEAESEAQNAVQVSEEVTHNVGEET